MAKVTVTISGGSPKIVEGVNTISELKQKLGKTNYLSAINGDPASDEDDLLDGAFVTLSENVKGA